MVSLKELQRWLCTERDKVAIASSEQAYYILMSESITIDIQIMLKRFAIDSGPLTGLEQPGRKRILFEDCEGFNIIKEIYDGALEKDGYIILDETPLNEKQIAEILNNYKNKEISAQMIYINNPDKIIESTEERHIQIVISYTDNDGKKALIAIGYPTSNKDSNTFLITKEQFLNPDSQQKNKEQRGRIYKYPVKVTEDHLIDKAHYSFFDSNPGIAAERRIQQKETLQKFTQFFQSNDYNGVNVHKILLDELRAKLKNNKSYYPREPYLFDNNTLSSLAQDAYSKQIILLKKIHSDKTHEYNDSKEKKRLEKEKRDENKAKKDSNDKKNKDIRDKMPEEIRQLDIAEDNLNQKRKRSKKTNADASNNSNEKTT